MERTAVILLNHGASDSTAGVAMFLQNIFRDREIIRLPGGKATQRRLSSFIARRRAPRVASLYRYMGGGSPLISYMQAQAATLETALDSEMPVFLGLRYFPPYIQDAVEAAVAAGAERIVVFPQYPQASTTTVGSVRSEFEAALGRVPAARDLEITTIAPFGSDPRYVELMARRVRSAAARAPDDATLVFSAHSIPAKFVDAGDIYPDQVAGQSAAIAAAAGFDSFEIGYQSRSGPVRWLEPETTALVESLIGQGRRDLVIVPVSFVQDHLETLVEIDVELATLVERAGGTLVRVRPPNVDDAFVEFSAALVREAIAAADTC